MRQLFQIKLSGVYPKWARHPLPPFSGTVGYKSMTLNTPLQEHHFKHLDKNMATIKHSNAMSKQRNESHRQYLLLLQLPDTDKFDVILKRSKVVKVDLEKAEVLIDEVQEFILMYSPNTMCAITFCMVFIIQLHCCTCDKSKTEPRLQNQRWGNPSPCRAPS